MVRLQPLWNKTAKDDLKEVQEAIMAKSQLFDETRHLGEKCSDALEEINKGIQAEDFDVVKDQTKGYLSDLSKYHEKMDLVLERHRNLEKSWLFQMASMKLKIRDMQKLQKLQAGKWLRFSVFKKNFLKSSGVCFQLLDKLHVLLTSFLLV